MTRRVVFVFGSNLAGRHGKGAALEAVKHWGAQYGVGEGETGNAYALPTKDYNLRSLNIEEIQQSYMNFWTHAHKNPNTQFLLTPCGTGLAGYSIQEIKSILPKKPLRNIWFTSDWYS